METKGQGQARGRSFTRARLGIACQREKYQPGNFECMGIKGMFQGCLLGSIGFYFNLTWIDPCVCLEVKS